MMGGESQILHQYNPCSSKIACHVEDFISYSSKNEADDYIARCLLACLAPTKAMNRFYVFSLDVELEFGLQ